MVTEKIVISLSDEMNKRLAKYDARIDDKPTLSGTRYKYIAADKEITFIATGATIGGAIGTGICPGIGTTIGTIGGGSIGLSTYIRVKLYYKQENKKLDNALKVVGFFGERGKNRNMLIQDIAQKIIKDKEIVLINLKDTDIKKKVVPYLAVNIMAAIKKNSNTGSDKITTVAEGLPYAKSHKI